MIDDIMIDIMNGTPFSEWTVNSTDVVVTLIAIMTLSAMIVVLFSGSDQNTSDEVKSDIKETQTIFKYINLNFDSQHLDHIHEMITMKTNFLFKQSLLNLIESHVTILTLSKTITDEVLSSLSDNYKEIVYLYISKDMLYLYTQQRTLKELERLKKEYTDSLSLGIHEALMAQPIKGTDDAKLP